MAHNVVHFAIHADDVERARRFYVRDVIGQVGAAGVASEREDGGAVALHERIAPLDGRGLRAFECTVSVDDLAEIRSAVVDNGGTVVLESFDIPTVGTLLQFLDTEGNVVGAMRYLTPPGAGAEPTG